jgi:hypothetical protein
MPRSKSDPLGPQASFDFDGVRTAASRPAPDSVPRALTEPQPERATIIRIDDRRRRNHLEVVRRLLAETGVFDVT